jgi:hypothetical protein
MKYWVDGCSGKKCQEKRQLAIIHVKGAAFCFLVSLLFYFILLFIGYGIWCVVLLAMPTPISKVGRGELLFRFSFLV